MFDDNLLPVAFVVSCMFEPSAEGSLSMFKSGPELATELFIITFLFDMRLRIYWLFFRSIDITLYSKCEVLACSMLDRFVIFSSESGPSL